MVVRNDVSASNATCQGRLLPSIPRSHHFSLLALRRCLSLPSLTPETDWRTWAALAEVGIRVVREEWARGIEEEVEKTYWESCTYHIFHPISLIQALFFSIDPHTPARRTHPLNAPQTRIQSTPARPSAASRQSYSTLHTSLSSRRV